ncbi:MAG: accessory factor UbiK family protein [Gammaproteobacteria bacterium]
MNQENAINRLVDQLARNLPGSVAAAREEFTAAARAVLSDAFSRMELVTREEFDAQARVLARSREQLEALARELQDLELRLAQLEDKRS